MRPHLEGSVEHKERGMRKVILLVMMTLDGFFDARAE
jgi:hypothetical protein